MTDRSDAPARFIAQLLAERYVPRTTPLAQRALIDIDFRTEVERRLAESGLRLLANPFAEHLAVALDYETLAPRLIDGALADLLANKTPAAVPPVPTFAVQAADTETLVKSAADALKLDE